MKRDNPKKIPKYFGAKRNKQGKHIPDPVANLRNPEDPEVKKYTIGHEFYREDLCRMKNMDATPLRKVLENYKRVSMCTSPLQVRKTLTDVKDVINQGHYKQYFSGLSPDVALLEFDASGYRGFFFLDPSRSLVSMVAVDLHPEDKKNKK